MRKSPNAQSSGYGLHSSSRRFELLTPFTKSSSKISFGVIYPLIFYMIGPVTSKAENMPKKVKEFFKKYGKPEGEVSG